MKMRIIFLLIAFIQIFMFVPSVSNNFTIAKVSKTSEESKMNISAKSALLIDFNTETVL